MNARGAVWIVALVLLVEPATAQTIDKNADLVIKETTLNRIVSRLGQPSQSGVHQSKNRIEFDVIFTDCQFFGFFECPPLTADLGAEFTLIPLARCREEGGGFAMVPIGPPVPWQWWITESRFSVSEGELTFSAKVLRRVGGAWSAVERSVDASVRIVRPNVLSIQVSDFEVPLVWNTKLLLPPEYPIDDEPVEILTVDVGKLSSFEIPLPSQSTTLTMPDGTTRTLTASARFAQPQYEPGQIRVGVDASFGDNVEDFEDEPWGDFELGSLDGGLRVGVSLFEEMAEAIGPLSWSRSFSFTVPIPNPVTLGLSTIDYEIDCTASATVENFRFAITSAGIQIEADLSATICGFEVPLGGTIGTTASLAFDAGSQTLNIATNSTNVRPTLTISREQMILLTGGLYLKPKTVSAPFKIDLSRYVKVPEISLHVGAFELDTTYGRKQLLLEARDVEVDSHDGYIEVKSNVVLW